MQGEAKLKRHYAPAPTFAPRWQREPYVFDPTLEMTPPIVTLTDQRKQTVTYKLRDKERTVELTDNDLVPLRPNNKEIFVDYLHGQCEFHAKIQRYVP